MTSSDSSESNLEMLEVKKQSPTESQTNKQAVYTAAAIMSDRLHSSTTSAFVLHQHITSPDDTIVVG